MAGILGRVVESGKKNKSNNIGAGSFGVIGRAVEKAPLPTTPINAPVQDTGAEILPFYPGDPAEGKLEPVGPTTVAPKAMAEPMRKTAPGSFSDNIQKFRGTKMFKGLKPGLKDMGDNDDSIIGSLQYALNEKKIGDAEAMLLFSLAPSESNGGRLPDDTSAGGGRKAMGLFQTMKEYLTPGSNILGGGVGNPAKEVNMLLGRAYDTPFTEEEFKKDKNIQTLFGAVVAKSKLGIAMRELGLDKEDLPNIDENKAAEIFARAQGRYLGKGKDKSGTDSAWYEEAGKANANIFLDNNVSIKRALMNTFGVQYDESKDTTASRNIANDPEVSSGEDQTIVSYLKSQGFKESAPFNQSRKRGPHKGIDMVKEAGAAITVPISGTVVAIGENTDTRGYAVEVVDADGNKHRMLHMNKPPVVKIGDKVEPGTVVGYVGSTGRSTGDHLHYDIHDKSGKRVDPNSFIIGKSVTAQDQPGTSISSKPYPSISEEAVNESESFLRSFLPEVSIDGTSEPVSDVNLSEELLSSYLSPDGTDEVNISEELLKEYDTEAAPSAPVYSGGFNPMAAMSSISAPGGGAVPELGSGGGYGAGFAPIGAGGASAPAPMTGMGQYDSGVSSEVSLGASPAGEKENLPKMYDWIAKSPDPWYSELYNYVANMSLDTGIPMPEIFGDKTLKIRGPLTVAGKVMTSPTVKKFGKAVFDVGSELKKELVPDFGILQTLGKVSNKAADKLYQHRKAVGDIAPGDDKFSSGAVENTLSNQVLDMAAARASDVATSYDAVEKQFPISTDIAETLVKTSSLPVRMAGNTFMRIINGVTLPLSTASEFVNKFTKTGDTEEAWKWAKVSFDRDEFKTLSEGIKNIISSNTPMTKDEAALEEAGANIISGILGLGISFYADPGVMAMEKFGTDAAKLTSGSVRKWMDEKRSQYFVPKAKATDEAASYQEKVYQDIKAGSDLLTKRNWYLNKVLPDIKKLYHRGLINSTMDIMDTATSLVFPGGLLTNYAITSVPNRIAADVTKLSEYIGQSLVEDLDNIYQNNKKVFTENPERITDYLRDLDVVVTAATPDGLPVPAVDGMLVSPVDGYYSVLDTPYGKMYEFTDDTTNNIFSIKIPQEVADTLVVKKADGVVKKGQPIGVYVRPKWEDDEFYKRANNAYKKVESELKSETYAIQATEQELKRIMSEAQELPTADIEKARAVVDDLLVGEKQRRINQMMSDLVDPDTTNLMSVVDDAEMSKINSQLENDIRSAKASARAEKERLKKLAESNAPSGKPGKDYMDEYFNKVEQIKGAYAEKMKNAMNIVREIKDSVATRLKQSGNTQQVVDDPSVKSALDMFVTVGKRETALKEAALQQLKAELTGKKEAALAEKKAAIDNFMKPALNGLRERFNNVVSSLETQAEHARRVVKGMSVEEARNIYTKMLEEAKVSKEAAIKDLATKSPEEIRDLARGYKVQKINELEQQLVDARFVAGALEQELAIADINLQDAFSEAYRTSKEKEKILSGKMKAIEEGLPISEVSPEFDAEAKFMNIGATNRSITDKIEALTRDTAILGGNNIYDIDVTKDAMMPRRSGVSVTSSELKMKDSVGSQYSPEVRRAGESLKALWQTVGKAFGERGEKLEPLSLIAVKPEYIGSKKLTEFYKKLMEEKTQIKLQASDGTVMPLIRDMKRDEAALSSLLMEIPPAELNKLSVKYVGEPLFEDNIFKRMDSAFATGLNKTSVYNFLDTVLRQSNKFTKVPDLVAGHYTPISDIISQVGGAKGSLADIANRFDGMYVPKAVGDTVKSILDMSFNTKKKSAAIQHLRDINNWMKRGLLTYSPVWMARNLSGGLWNLYMSDTLRPGQVGNIASGIKTGTSDWNRYSKEFTDMKELLTQEGIGRKVLADSGKKRMSDTQDIVSNLLKDSAGNVPVDAPSLETVYDLTRNVFSDLSPGAEAEMFKAVVERNYTGIKKAMDMVIGEAKEGKYISKKMQEWNTAMDTFFKKVHYIDRRALGYTQKEALQSVVTNFFDYSPENYSYWEKKLGVKDWTMFWPWTRNIHKQMIENFFPRFGKYANTEKMLASMGNIIDGGYNPGEESDFNLQSIPWMAGQGVHPILMDKDIKGRDRVIVMTGKSVVPHKDATSMFDALSAIIRANPGEFPTKKYLSMLAPPLSIASEVYQNTDSYTGDKIVGGTKPSPDVIPGVLNFGQTPGGQAANYAFSQIPQLRGGREFVDIVKSPLGGGDPRLSVMHKVMNTLGFNIGVVYPDDIKKRFTNSVVDIGGNPRLVSDIEDRVKRSMEMLSKKNSLEVALQEGRNIEQMFQKGMVELKQMRENAPDSKTFNMVDKVIRTLEERGPDFIQRIKTKLENRVQ